MSNILLCGNNGRLYNFDTKDEHLNIVFEAENINEYLKGITCDENFIYVGSNFRVYKLNKDNFRLIDVVNTHHVDLEFQHLRLIDNKLFIVSPNSYLLIIVDIEFNSIAQKKITGNSLTRCNNIANIARANDILKYKDKYYINYGLTQRSLSDHFSVIEVFNSDFTLKEKISHHYKTSRIANINNKLWSLSNSFLDNKTHNISGLFVEDEIKISLKQNFTLWDFSVDAENIYLVGGITDYIEKMLICGVLLIYDLSFKLVKIYYMEDINSIFGCSLLNNDRV